MHLLAVGSSHCVLADRQGEVAPEAAAQVAGRLLELGCYEVSMGDTIGVGTPASITRMFQVPAAAALLCQSIVLPAAYQCLCRASSGYLGGLCSVIQDNCSRYACCRTAICHFYAHSKSFKDSTRCKICYCAGVHSSHTSIQAGSTPT